MVGCGYWIFLLECLVSDFVSLVLDRGSGVFVRGIALLGLSGACVSVVGRIW